MSKTAYDVYRVPGGRSEREVAAEVIVRLLEHKVLQFSPRTLAEASAATGVPLRLIQAAWERRKLPSPGFGRSLVVADDGALFEPEPPTTPTLTAVPEVVQQQEPRHKDSYPSAIRAANERRRSEKEPEPGKRICSKCKELKLKTEFSYKNKRTGQLRSMCNSCMSSYQHDRYLTSERLDRLGAVLRFILEDGDEHAGMICPDCESPCRIGDEVMASDAILRHANH